MEAILKINNLSKSFGRNKVVDNISLEVYAGEVFGFLGPNGAGKTTTIKMILGFLGCDSGDIYIEGLDLRKKYEQAMAKVGGIVENPDMYKNLSGMTNLKMSARLHKSVTPQRIAEVIQTVGMESRIHQKVKKYSLGMKQRIGLAQVMLHRPRLLILDEPTNGLDPEGIKQLRDILKDLAHQENAAVFVSSHLLSEMQLMCDRVGIINNGRLIGVKPVNELLADKPGDTVYRFLVRQPSEVTEILNTNGGIVIKDIAYEHADLQITEAQVPDITALLVSKGIRIYGINKLETSLEEAFIDIINGGKDIG